MSPIQMTMDQIKKKGFAALMRELGPVGYVRFMQEFLGRKGDYTKDRAAWVEDIDLTGIERKFGGRRPRKRKP